MTVLCVGSVVVLAAGNVQALLLMSGRSSWGAFNKLVVVVVNVVGNLILLPRVGIIGAAAMWAACMALDTALAAYQVRRTVGIAVFGPTLLRVAAAVVLCTVLPSAVVLWLAGQTVVSFLTSLLLSGLLLLAYARHDRARLHLDQLLKPGRNDHDHAV